MDVETLYTAIARLQEEVDSMPESVDDGMRDGLMLSIKCLQELLMVGLSSSRT